MLLISEEQTNFSTDEVSLRLNGMFHSDGWPNMLEGKVNQCVDMVHSFINASADILDMYTEDVKLLKVSSLYYELVAKIYGQG